MVRAAQQDVDDDNAAAPLLTSAAYRDSDAAALGAGAGRGGMHGAGADGEHASTSGSTEGGAEAKGSRIGNEIRK